METNKPKPRPKPCRYGAECKRMSTCKFTHPAQSNNNLARKEVDRSTIPCRYGLGCSRSKCPFLHPEPPPLDTSPVSQESISTTPTALPDSPEVLSRNNKAIKKKCRYGAACNRKNCKFVHPLQFLRSVDGETPQALKLSESHVGGMGSSAASTLNQYVTNADGDRAGREVEEHSILPPAQNIRGSKKASAESNGQTSAVSQNGAKSNPNSNGAAGKSRKHAQPDHHHPEFPYVSDIEQNVQVLIPHHSPQKKSHARTPLYESKPPVEHNIHSQQPPSMSLPRPPGIDSHKLSPDDAWLYEVLKVEMKGEAAANGSATKAKHSSPPSRNTKTKPDAHKSAKSSNYHGKKRNGTITAPIAAPSVSDPRTIAPVVPSGMNNLSNEDISEARRAAFELRMESQQEGVFANNAELLSTLLQLCRSKQQMVMDGLERSMTFAGTDDQVDETVVVELLELNELLLTSISMAESTLKIASVKPNAKNGFGGKENRETQKQQVVPKSPKHNSHFVAKAKEMNHIKVQKHPSTESKTQKDAPSESSSSGKSRKEQQKSLQDVSQPFKPKLKPTGRTVQAPSSTKAQKEYTAGLKAPTSSKKDQNSSPMVKPKPPKQENQPSNGKSSAKPNSSESLKGRSDASPGSKPPKVDSTKLNGAVSKSSRVEDAVVSDNIPANDKISNKEQVPTEQEPAHNPVDVVQQEKERMAKLLEEERQKAAAAREKKKSKKSKKFDRWVKEQEELKSSRAESWRELISKEQDITELIKQLLVTEFLRQTKNKVMGLTSQRVLSDTHEVLMSKSREAYRVLFGERNLRVVIAGMDNKDLNDRQGTLQHFDKEKGKFCVGLDTKRSGSDGEIHYINPENLEKVVARHAKPNKVLTTSFEVNITGFLVYGGLSLDLCFELEKSEVTALGSAGSMKAGLHDFVKRRDSEEHRRKLEKEAERKREEEDAKRRKAAKAREEAAWKHRQEEMRREKEEFKEMRREWARERRQHHGHGQSFDPFSRAGFGMFEDMFSARFGRGPGFSTSDGFFTFMFGGIPFQFCMDDDSDEDFFDDFDDRWEEKLQEEKEEENRKSAEILGVTEDADERTLKVAYRKMALQYHPDKWKSDSEHGMSKADAEEKFKAMQSAYDHLMSNFDDDED